MRYIILPVWSGSPATSTCLENLQREAPRSHPDQMQIPPQLAPSSPSPQWAQLPHGGDSFWLLVSLISSSWNEFPPTTLLLHYSWDVLMKVVVLSTLSSESVKLSITHQRPTHRDETNIWIRNKVIEKISKKLRINNTQEITFLS